MLTLVPLQFIVCYHHKMLICPLIHWLIMTNNNNHILQLVKLLHNCLNISLNIIASTGDDVVPKPSVDHDKQQQSHTTTGKLTT